MSTDTEKLLEERGKSHGEYSEHADITQRLMDVIMSGRNWRILPPMIRETLHMIAHKVGRIVTGDPCHKDHYDDISGYSILISQRIDSIREQVRRLREIIFPRGYPETTRPGTPEDGGHHERDNRPLVYRIPKHLMAAGVDGILIVDQFNMRVPWTSDKYEMVVEKEKCWEIHNPRSEALRQQLERIVSPNRQEI